jgi:archaellum component FlaD/FlaE
MSDSFLDHLPSQEREKIRKRLRSPAEYQRLREKVKGPEDLEREMKKSEQIAEVSFRLETEPETAQRLQDRITKDMKERGVETVLENEDISESARLALEQGRFNVSVEAHPKTHEDTLVVIPEGNVQDRIPVKPLLNEGYVQLLLSA